MHALILLVLMIKEIAHWSYLSQAGKNNLRFFVAPSLFKSILDGPTQRLNRASDSVLKEDLWTLPW